MKQVDLFEETELHPYPATKPEKEGRYLILLDFGDEQRWSVSYFDTSPEMLYLDGGWDYLDSYVRYWGDLPDLPDEYSSHIFT